MKGVGIPTVVLSSMALGVAIGLSFSAFDDPDHDAAGMQPSRQLPPIAWRRADPGSAAATPRRGGAPEPVGSRPTPGISPALIRSLQAVAQAGSRTGMQISLRVVTAEACGPTVAAGSDCLVGAIARAD